MKDWRCIGVVTLSGVLGGVAVSDAAAAAELAPAGPEFRVNLATAGFEDSPDVAAAGDRFLVVWSADELDVRARLLDGRGHAVGGEFGVTTGAPVVARTPAVARHTAGEFVAAWAEGSGTSNDDRVLARRIRADGVFLGVPFRVDQSGPEGVGRVDVTSGLAGGFIVAWAALTPARGTDASYAIRARRFASDGTPFGQQFQVDGPEPTIAERPAGAVSGTGGFAVAWSERTGYDDRHTVARVLDTLGQPLGAPFVVSTEPTTGDVDIAGSPNGDFVIVWPDDDPYSYHRSNTIRARRVSATGQPLGAEVEIVSPLLADCPQAPGRRICGQSSPRVADTGEGFRVAWDAIDLSLNRRGVLIADATQVEAQALDASGEPLGAAFGVSSVRDGWFPTARRVAVATLEGRRSDLVVWRGMFVDPLEDPDPGIRARLLGERLFADGFESGATCSWSLVEGGASCR